MRYLGGREEEEAVAYMQMAQEIAKRSCCLRSKGGSVIVKDDYIIGSGINSPPGDKPLERCVKDSLPADFKSDKTCCLHAEQRAIFEALRHNPGMIKDSRLYFIRLDMNDQKMFSGKPYCTICSKMALDVGIAEFVLWHEKGICVYSTEEYNTLSFQYRKE